MARWPTKLGNQLLGAIHVKMPLVHGLFSWLAVVQTSACFEHSPLLAMSTVPLLSVFHTSCLRRSPYSNHVTMVLLRTKAAGRSQPIHLQLQEYGKPHFETWVENTTQAPACSKLCVCECVSKSGQREKLARPVAPLISQRSAVLDVFAGRKSGRASRCTLCLAWSLKVKKLEKCDQF